MLDCGVRGRTRTVKQPALLRSAKMQILSLGDKALDGGYNGAQLK